MGLFRNRLKLAMALGLVATTVIEVAPAIAQARAIAYVVTASADSGEGSLRQALTDINEAQQAGEITFDLPEDDRTIALASPLPPALQPVTIDGASLATKVGPSVAIVGLGSSEQTGACLTLRGGASVVRSLVIHRCGTAIRIIGPGGNVIERSFLGVDRDGVSTPFGNTFGVFVTNSADNRIGGASTGNIIGGSRREAIRLDGPDGIGSARTQIVGNLIGLGADGVTAAPNETGISIYASPDVQVVRNVISGSKTSAIFSFAPGAVRNVIQGNHIGTDRSGLLARPNNTTFDTQFGPELNNTAIVVFGSGHLIGGSAPGEGNIISGNRTHGVYLSSQSSRVIGNRIGVAVDGSPLPNGGTGVLVGNSREVAVGGSAPGEANVIANNGGSGIALGAADFGGIPAPREGNALRGNSIRDNAGLGINIGARLLDAPAVDSNDSGDGDQGHNGRQNYPIVDAVTQGESTTSVTATLASALSTTYVVDLYASDSCDTSGSGEGDRLVGTATVTTGGRNGVATFTTTVPRQAEGTVLTATATSPNGSTSEFSPCAAVPTSSLLGYWAVTESGSVYDYSQPTLTKSLYFGSTEELTLSAPIKGIAPTPTGRGYRLVGSDGGVFTFGDADYLGSLPESGVVPAAPVVRLASTPTGNGYWLVAADGGVFAFGDAGFFGSLADLDLQAPIIAMVPSPTGNGYWLAGADGGVFAFGDAMFHGSAAHLDLAAPITALSARPDGRGYWIAAADGGVFTFGASSFAGSAADLELAGPVVAIAATPSGAGYWLLGSDGGVFTYGDAIFLGAARDRSGAPFVGLAPQRGLPT